MEQLNPSRALATETQPKSSESGPSRETRRRAAVAWEGLKQIFGTGFLTVHGDTPSSIWLGKIAELTDEQVSAGLKRIADMQREYPVNLTEFMEACKPKPVGRRYLGTPTTPSQLRQLEAQSAERTHVDSCLANMRRTLSVSREPGEDDETPERPRPRMDNACKCPLDEPGTCAVCRKFAGYLGDFSDGRTKAPEA